MLKVTSWMFLGCTQRPDQPMFFVLLPWSIRWLPWLSEICRSFVFLVCRYNLNHGSLRATSLPNVRFLPGNKGIIEGP